MSDAVIGTCSICGGQVATPSLWGGIIPPTPHCLKCGASAANHGPVIQMQKIRPTLPNFTNTTTKLDCVGVDGGKIGLTTRHT